MFRRFRKKKTCDEKQNSTLISSTNSAEDPTKAPITLSTSPPDAAVSPRSGLRVVSRTESSPPELLSDDDLVSVSLTSPPDSLTNDTVKDTTDVPSTASASSTSTLFNKSSPSPTVSELEESQCCRCWSFSKK